MDLGITGKVAVVAAASQGIGLAIAQSLAREGARVAICGRDADRLLVAMQTLGKGHRAYQVDLCDGTQIYQWIEQVRNELGPPSILVTNTGGPAVGTPDSLSDEQWLSGFQSTILNTTRLVDACLNSMKTQQWGRIVHLTSLVAKDPTPFLTISSTLRAGISALTRVQAMTFGKDGITVNALLPGHTSTDRQEHLLKARALKAGTSIEVQRELTTQNIPLGRFASPSEIADVAAFICSERASFLTGAQIVVDGAASKGLG